MTRQTEEHRYQHDEEDHLRYSRESSPETAERLDLINEMALYDEAERAITHPRRGANDPRVDWFIDRLGTAILSANPETEGMNVYSFDIDLTLQMPQDTPGCQGTIPIRRLIELQESGCIVGTCSDREPSEQSRDMADQGFSPDFCIPKELLKATGSLLPGARLIHVGDDELRDRKTALEGGWEHRWPAQEE